MSRQVFRQVLGYKEPTAAGDAQPKVGVVRWEQFERAMKRIGFDIVQTAGSSVRFDPPAKTARPITFHRVSNRPRAASHTSTHSASATP